MEKQITKSVSDKIQYDYDKRADVLYISFGKPQKSICVEKEEGILFCVDPFKDKVVGITVIDSKEKFARLSKRAVTKFVESKLSKFRPSKSL